MKDKEEEKVEEEVKEDQKDKDYELVQVPTQHSLAIQTPDDEHITTEQGIVIILNKLTKIESLLG